MRLLVTTLDANDNFPVLNKDNLTIPVEMQLSEKGKTFSQVFSFILNSSLNFEHFQRKMTVIDFVFPKLRTLKTLLDQCLKSLVSEDPSTSNMVNWLKHSWNLQHSTFIIFIDHNSNNWVEKRHSYWHAKS